MIKILFVLLLLSQYALNAEENPFNLQKEFKNIDDKEESLFSTMKGELKKAAVVPSLVIIGFKKSNCSDSKIANRTRPNILYILPTIERTQEQKIDKCALEACIDRESILDKAIDSTKKREQRRKIKVDLYKDWIDANVVSIDLKKEKQLFQKYLDKEYEKAVCDVAK